MATNRALVFARSEIYHVFNRGVERRPIFTNKREYERMKELMRYYRFANVPMRYSQLITLPKKKQKQVWDRLKTRDNYEVILIAYVLMPNHFHIVLKQISDQGVSRFLSNISNSFTKYFNTKYQRPGPLLQGPFKAIRVETDEQLLHLTRYVHLNPVASFLIEPKELDDYPWSSLPEYLNPQDKEFLCDTTFIGNFFPSKDRYRAFVYDQIGYAQELEKIKHLVFE